MYITQSMPTQCDIVKMISALAFALVLSASAKDINPCSQVKPVDNFDFDAFSGYWYEFARYPTNFEDHFDCVTARYYREGNSLKFSANDVVDGTHKNSPFIGTIEISDKSGGLNFLSPAFKSFGPNSELTGHIVNIIYDKYCIFYQCDYDADKKTVKDHVWILSRSKTLDPEARKSMEDFFNANKNLNMSKLIWNHFSDDACKAKD